MTGLTERAFNFFLHPDRRNFFIYSIGAFFLKGVSFLLIPMYTSLLSAAEFGSYDLLRTFGSVTEIILSLGLLQLIYAEFYSDDSESKRKFLSAFISIYLNVSGLLYIVLTAGLFFFTDHLFPGVSFLLVAMVMITTFLNFFQVMLLTVLKLSFQALRVTMLQVILGVTTLLLNILLVYALRTGIDGIVYSTLIVTVLSCCYGIYHFRNKLKGFSFRLDKGQLQHYLKLGMPFIPNVLAFWIMISANRWILLHYSGLDEVGIYSLAFRLTAVFEPLLIEPFLAAYTPVILKKFKEGNYDQGYVIRIAGILALFFFAGWLLQHAGSWVVGEAFTASIALVPPLAIAYAFNLIAQTSALILIHRKKVLHLLVCVVVGSLSGIIMNFILVPSYGAMGSAVSTAIGHAVWALAVVFLSMTMLNKLKRNLA